MLELLRSMVEEADDLPQSQVSVLIPPTHWWVGGMGGGQEQ